MSGFGERFRRSGYEIPKPLIEAEGKPIIAHVIDMFPDETDFLFICNLEHLNNPSYNMRNTLNKYCPTGRIVGIPPHKLGPINAVKQVEHLIDMERPVVVNYCDFTCFWDWNHFKSTVTALNCDGAIPAYKGFHPHTLGSTNYAYLRESKNWLLDIQEKKPFTDNRMEEYASSGTYYFSSGRKMSYAFQETLDKHINVNGEYYISLAYKILLQLGDRILIYPLQHFMQWGTPEDLSEYRQWSDAFRNIVKPHYSLIPPSGSVIIPMAGMGQRFTNEGYSAAKPLIPVSGKPMVVQAVNDLPLALYYCFVMRRDMPDYEEIAETLTLNYPNALIEAIPEVTEGQACSALLGIDALFKKIGDTPGPITIGACDNGALYDYSAFDLMVKNSEVDVIVWGACGYTNAIRQPKMYGWIDATDGLINHISVKTPLKSPASDPVVLGAFTFKRAEDFRNIVERLIARNGRVNGEFYIDSCINDAIELGLKCYLFKVDTFLSWGTPNDLRTFEYWQSCFHKWHAHPYSLKKDPRVSVEALEMLDNKYAAIIPDLLILK
jgi:NDP-sugar pyrophosphorylase family protein